MSRNRQMPNGTIERNPEATPQLSEKHVRILEHMKNHRLGKVAAHPNRSISTFQLAEIAALDVAIAELNELLAKRS